MQGFLYNMFPIASQKTHTCAQKPSLLINVNTVALIEYIPNKLVVMYVSRH